MLCGCDGLQPALPAGEAALCPGGSARVEGGPWQRRGPPVGGGSHSRAGLEAELCRLVRGRLWSVALPAAACARRCPSTADALPTSWDAAFNPWCSGGLALIDALRGTPRGCPPPPRANPCRTSGVCLLGPYMALLTGVVQRCRTNRSRELTVGLGWWVQRMAAAAAAAAAILPAVGAATCLHPTDSGCIHDRSTAPVAGRPPCTVLSAPQRSQHRQSRHCRPLTARRLHLQPWSPPLLHRPALQVSGPGSHLPAALHLLSLARRRNPLHRLHSNQPPAVPGLLRRQHSAQGALPAPGTWACPRS